MLKITGMKIGLISDVDLHMKIEKAIRGGICTIGSKRYVKFNNKYCPQYDPTKPITHGLYIDANSLYSTAMTMSLPYQEPKSVEIIPPLEEVVDEIMQITDNDPICRLYVVDLQYPKELHEMHNDYLCLPPYMLC